jgi:basic amino acid/polyamine antiporter, APA family
MPEVILAAPGEGGLFNFPAIVLVTLCCLLLMRGARESATVNTVMVIIKIAVLIFFVIIAFTAFSGENFAPFAPFGVAGIGVAASSIFFTFIGLDAVSTAGEEVHNPRRTLPLAIIFATIIVTTVYILVAVAGIGAQQYRAFEGQEAGLAVILRNITGSAWPAAVLSAGAVISIFSVTLVTLYGQTRILFAMGRDGMLPEIFHRINPTSLVPVRNTIIVGIFVGALAGFVPLGVLIDLTSMGTLVAFTVVSIGVIILRRTQPDLPRGFRVPGYPVTPILSAGFALYIMSQLPYSTFALFAVWLGVAAIIYFSYSARHSRLARGRPSPRRSRNELSRRLDRRPRGKGRPRPGQDAGPHRRRNPYRVHRPPGGLGTPFLSASGRRVRLVPRQLRRRHDRRGARVRR